MTALHNVVVRVATALAVLALPVIGATAAHAAGDQALGSRAGGPHTVSAAAAPRDTPWPPATGAVTPLDTPWPPAGIAGAARVSPSVRAQDTPWPPTATG